MPMGNKERRVTRLIKLNKDIHKTSHQIEKIEQDMNILKSLAEEFSRLVFDKLALDAVYQRDFNSDVDLQALRVILGRTKVAMQYFDDKNAPVSEMSKVRSMPFELVVNAPIHESRYSLYFSCRCAEKRLCKLTDQLVELQRKCDGMTGVIRRFEEDNQALKADIRALRQSPGPNYDSNFGQHTWARLAGVDLMTTAEKRQSAISQKRMSSLNMRRMSVTSTKSHSSTNEHVGSLLGNLFDTPASPSGINLSQQNAFNSYPQYSSSWRHSMHTNMDHRLSLGARRRSGALSDSDLSRDDSMASTNTSISNHSYTKPNYHPIYAAHLGQMRRSTGGLNIETAM